MESRKNGTDESTCRARIETQTRAQICGHSGGRRGVGQMERVAWKHIR